MINRLIRWTPWLGAIAWCLLWLGARPTLDSAGWAELLILLAALVLTPLGLRLIDESAPHAPPGGSDEAADSKRVSNGELLSAALRWARWGQLPAALVLCVAFLLPVGQGAAMAAFPWLAVTGLAALAGGVRLTRCRQAGDVGLGAALLFLFVGGVWTVASRLGHRPLDFEPIIVLLTAVHFHYAGFVLPLLAAQLVARRPSRLTWAGLWGTVAGVPLTAVGITGSQLGAAPWLECATAQVTALAGWLVAAGLIQQAIASPGRREARGLVAISGWSLVVGMALASLYGARAYLPLTWLDIPWMQAVHGTTNGLGFALCGLVGWSWWKPAR